MWNDWMIEWIHSDGLGRLVTASERIRLVISNLFTECVRNSYIWHKHKAVHLSDGFSKDIWIGGGWVGGWVGGALSSFFGGIFLTLQNCLHATSGARGNGISPARVTTGSLLFLNRQRPVTRKNAKKSLTLLIVDGISPNFAGELGLCCILEIWLEIAVLVSVDL